jgi:hypothetical protein
MFCLRYGDAAWAIAAFCRLINLETARFVGIEKKESQRSSVDNASIYERCFADFSHLLLPTFLIFPC